MSNDGKGFTFRAEDDGAGELMIYDYIGFGGVEAKAVNDALRAAKGLREITVRINSPGGIVFDGVAIYNSLKRSAQKVKVIVDGIAASAASIIAMAGDEIVMGGGSFMMIHQASGLTIGTSNDHAQTADVLEKMDGELAAIYAKRSGKDRAAIIEMMNAETWFTAEEAVDEGFADYADNTETEPENYYDKDTMTMFNYQNVPAELIARLTLAASATAQAPRSITPTIAGGTNEPEAADSTKGESEMAEENKNEPEPVAAPIVEAVAEVVTPTEPERIPATLAEIKAECPECDAAFIVAQLEAQATADEARKAWMNILLERAKAAKQTPGVEPVKTTRDGIAGDIAPEDAGEDRDGAAHLARAKAYQAEHKCGIAEALKKTQ